MKDWKTYAIAALAIWCAVLTFKSKTDSPSGAFATEEYARKCAIAVGCAVHGGDEKKCVEWFNEEIDGFGKPKKQAEAERAESQTAGDNPRGGLLERRLSLESQLGKKIKITNDNAAKIEERKRMHRDHRKKVAKQLADEKKDAPYFYSLKMGHFADDLKRAEEREKKYPLNCSNEFEKKKASIEDLYGREVLEDALKRFAEINSGAK